ncbi:AMP-binding protein [Saccharothrix sp. HUAS TT10]|uniref:AMP-binding protein n=1 Tax=Saccharothrix sp. HUAS TT10 TaxID=3447450 RepID=UPI003F6FA32D
MEARLYLDAVLSALKKYAEETPRAIAVKDATAEWTYERLWRSARSAAADLRASGARRGRAVALHAAKSPESIALVVACGLADVPVLLPSVDLGPDAAAALRERASCSHTITWRHRSAPGGPLCFSVEPSGLPPRAPLPADTPLVLTTSGSTGVPKPVALSGAGVERFLRWAATEFGIGRGTVVLSYAPLNFDLTLLDIWTTLHAGGTVRLVDKAEATDGRALRALLAEDRVEVVQAVPLLFRLLDGDGASFPAVRHVITTGDVLPPQQLPRLAELFPNAAAHNLYGCTETNDSAIHRIDPDRDATRRALPIGRPIAGAELLVVDADDRPLAGAAVGELLVSTPFQAHGYLDRSLTASRFTTIRDGGSAKVFYRSGDIVRRDADGLLHLEGRDDFHVKVRGVRTNMQEVEHVLGSHPDVQEVAVVAVPDDTAGHRLHAELRTTAGSRVNGLHLRVHCAASLPRTAIPSSFRMNDRDLPRTSTGKVDRTAILASLSTEGN